MQCSAIHIRRRHGQKAAVTGAQLAAARNDGERGCDEMDMQWPALANLHSAEARRVALPVNYLILETSEGNEPNHNTCCGRPFF